MSVDRPPDPTENNVKTFYRRPVLDRFTGRYTVSWKSDGHVAAIRVRNRLVDLEGFAPPLGALKRLPAVVSSYIASKRQRLLPSPRPFLVFEAIEHMESLVHPGSKVVELGGGNSTLWFLERGAHVTCIEHCAEWAHEIIFEAQKRFGDEVRGRLTVQVAAGIAAIDYAQSLADGSFDLALVDCMNAYTWRLDGVHALGPKVRPGGVLCLDNSDHPNNWAAVTSLGRGQRTRFTGYAPMCPVVSQTSFWTMGQSAAAA